jgi:hypothetical protein
LWSVVKSHFFSHASVGEYPAFSVSTSDGAWWASDTTGLPP